MTNTKYSKVFRIKVAKEALLPENEGLERVIAGKYGILPATVRRWRDHYQEYGEKAFFKGYTKKDTRSPQEKELEKKVEELEEEVKILKKQRPSWQMPSASKVSVHGGAQRRVLHCQDGQSIKSV